MNYKKHFNYFHSTDKWYYIGLPIAILGCILFVSALFYFFFIPYQIPIGMVLTAIGALIAFLPYSRCSKEAEIDEAVRTVSESYAKDVCDRLSIGNQLIQTVEPLTVGGYVYEDQILMRRGRIDRTCRTAQYSAAKIFCAKQGIIIAEKSFSLIEESENERMDSYSFADMDHTAVVDEQFICKDQSKIRVSYFVITKDNNEIFRLPVKHDIAIDKLCNTINEMIRKAKKT